MSDEQGRDAGGEPGPEGTRPLGRAGDPDRTRNQPDEGPRSDDAWITDGTQQMPRADDSTQPMPRAGAGPAGRPAEGTQPMPGADDSTRPMPRAADGALPMPADGTRPMAPVAGDGAWAGRAEVRPPRPGVAREYEETEWPAPTGPEQRGRWWTPIVVGIVILLLVALLGWGIYLIVNSNSDKGTPAPTATVTAGPATTLPTTAAPTATTAAPTTAAPTTAATTGPAAVAVPALKGRDQDQAQAALAQQGLSARLRFRPTTAAAPGTVIDSDPQEGQQVPPGTVVTLVIAVEPSTTQATPSATTTQQTDDD